MPDNKLQSPGARAITNRKLFVAQLLQQGKSSASEIHDILSSATYPAGTNQRNPYFSFNPETNKAWSLQTIAKDIREISSDWSLDMRDVSKQHGVIFGQLQFMIGFAQMQAMSTGQSSWAREWRAMIELALRMVAANDSGDFLLVQEQEQEQEMLRRRVLAMLGLDAEDVIIQEEKDTDE